MSNAQAASLLSDERVADTDLIAGVYEGGFKTWEGGLDLARYLAAAALQGSQQRRQDEQQQQPQQQQYNLPELLGPGSRVMELVGGLLFMLLLPLACLPSTALYIESQRCSPALPLMSPHPTLPPRCTHSCRAAGTACPAWWRCGRAPRFTSRTTTAACSPR